MIIEVSENGKRFPVEITCDRVIINEETKTLEAYLNSRTVYMAKEDVWTSWKIVDFSETDFPDGSFVVDDRGAVYVWEEGVPYYAEKGETAHNKSGPFKIVG